jgi:hypothetical protein
MKVGPAAKKIIDAYKSVGGAGSAEQQKAHFLGSKDIEGPGLMVTFHEAMAIHRAKNRALVSINQQVLRESGGRVIQDKSMLAKIKKAQADKSRASTSWLTSGTEVEVGKLGSTQGMLVAEKHLVARQANSKGRLLNWVPGHGGDVWAVDHGGRRIAVYSIDEIKPTTPPAVPSSGLWLGE